MFLFIVKFTLIKYKVCEIFDGYSVDSFHSVFLILIFISDVGREYVGFHGVLCFLCVWLPILVQ